MVLLESDLEGRFGQLEPQHRAEPDPNVLGRQSNEKVDCCRVERLRDDQRLHDEARATATRFAQCLVPPIIVCASVQQFRCRGGVLGIVRTGEVGSKT